MMNYLVIGLGSMGKRRIRNLLANDVPAANIYGFDLREDRIIEAADKYEISASTDLGSIDLSRVDAVIISTGPAQHYQYMEFAVENGKHFFVEAGIHAEGIGLLMDQLAEKELIGFPSCTMRYFPGPIQVKQWITDGEVGPVYCWQYQSGQYLPDWHPWESIHDFYVSKRETGACREIVPFELAWLIDVFGDIQSVDGMKAHVSEIDADIDDVYMLQLRHKNNVMGQLIVDVIARDAVRHVRILGRDGSIEWNAADKQARLFKADTKEWTTVDLGSGSVESGYINPEEPYINEIAYFISCIETKNQPDFDFTDYLKTVNILYKSEKSDETGQRQ